MKASFRSAPEPDAEALERGRMLFAGPCTFLKGVAEILKKKVRGGTASDGSCRRRL